MDERLIETQEPTSSYQALNSTVLQSSAVRPELDGATRTWAISAVVLGCLYGLFLWATLGLTCVVDASWMARSAPGTQWLTELDTLLYVILPVGFIAGGAGVLWRREIGRLALAACSGLAVFVAVGGLIATRLNGAGQTSSSWMGWMVFSAFWTLAEVAYCALLWRQMTSPAARLSTHA